MFRELCKTSIWLYAPFSSLFLCLGVYASTKNSPSPPMIFLPQTSVAGCFWAAPPFLSQPSCSDKCSLGNNSSLWVPPSLWSWLLGCAAFCPPESEMLSSSADSRTKSNSSAGLCSGLAVWTAGFTAANSPIMFCSSENQFKFRSLSCV